MKSESEFRNWTFLSPLTEEVEGTEALLEVFMQVVKEYLLQYQTLQCNTMYDHQY